MTHGDILRAAAQVIREKGLLKFSRYNLSGPGHCALGAIDVVAAREKISDGTKWGGIPTLGGKSISDDVLAPVVCRALGIPTTGTYANHALARWNNQDERTQEEVASGLALAAVYADQQRVEI